MEKILVIDDEQSIQEDIAQILELEGFAVVTAKNGQIGVDLALQEIPDVILCDVAMPDLDGYQVLERLHQDPVTQWIPFIFISARSSRSDLRLGMTLGADDYLTKPFTRLELLESIRSRIKKGRRYRDLLNQIQALQNASLLKDEFLIHASHDLRAPLTNIKVAVLMLNQAETPEARQRYLSILEFECQRQTDLMADLLNWQRLEAGAHLFHSESIQPNAHFESLLNRFQARLESRQLHLKVEVSGELPLLETDKNSLDQIVSELLHNACKYTPVGGEIVFQVTLKESSSKQGSMLSITVSNSTEIPQSALPHLFTPFYRIPGGDPEQQGGTGLGLALCQKLTEQIHGSLEVASQEGWTHFTLALPLKHQADG
jgi:signal transduction histidine kinase